MKTLLVSSGKGGVGKSSLATAIALTMRHVLGVEKVGIFDADLHGSSIPTLMGLEESGNAEASASLTRTNYEVQCTSIEFCTSKPRGPIAWRGLMQTKGIGDLWQRAEWKNGPLDLCVVDLPPGTGDIHMTFGALVKEKASLICISTPDSLAKRSAVKGVELFKLMKGIPLIGTVYNMVHWECYKCGAVNGASAREENMKDEIGLPILGRLPFKRGIATLPLQEQEQESPAMRELISICHKILKQL